MAFEIERKFLVKGDAWRGLVEPLCIRLDVTNDHRYKNNNLAAHPFSEWSL